jgi:long-chain acyl-CoA synthetase
MYSFSKALQRAALVNRRGTATWYRGRETSWEDTLNRVRRIAGVLVDCGVGDGDAVAMLGVNTDSLFQCFFAVPWAGGMSVPLNYRLAVPEIAECLNDAECKVLLVDEAWLHLVPAICQAAPSVARVLCLGPPDDALGVASLAQLAEAREPIEDRGRGGDDIAALYYTGGTTGRAKGVMITHEGMVVNILQWILAVEVTSRDVMLVIAPMFHLVGGLNALAVTVLAAQAAIVDKFDPADVVRIIRGVGVTKAAMVPIMVEAIVAHLDAHPTELPSLKRISYGGAPMTEAGLRRALNALPQLRFYQIYGQTEGGPNITMLAPEYHVLEGAHAGRLRSAGKAIAGTIIRIVDAEDRPLPAGEVGEIVVQGLTVSPGYWKLPDVTAETHRGGWLHTGDVGYLDEDGFLYIVDRLKDMIITGGENVYSAEVENVVGAHPAVAQCVVIGIPSERWGEQVHAIVRLKEGMEATGEEIVAHCRRSLGGFKCVRSVEFRDEPFPVSGANKILKRELRAAYWKGRDTNL